MLTLPMLARIRALRGVGLSAEATARVIELDFGVKPAGGTIQRYAPVGHYVAGAARGRAGVAHSPAGSAFTAGNVQGKVPE